MSDEQKVREKLIMAIINSDLSKWTANDIIKVAIVLEKYIIEGVD